MKTIHLLTNETKEHQIIETKLFSNEFIISIPHSGLLVPTKIKEKLNLNQSILIGTDLFTNQLYNFEQGIKINFNLNPYVINVGRNIIPDPTKPKHLQTDPFHLDSLTGEPILKEEFYEEEKQELLQHYHHYHQQLEQAIKEMKQVLSEAKTEAGIFKKFERKEQKDYRAEIKELSKSIKRARNQALI